AKRLADLPPHEAVGAVRSDDKRSRDARSVRCEDLEAAAAAMDIRHTHRQQIGARALGGCQKRAVEFCATRDHQRRRVRRQGDVCVSALVRLDESGGANSHGGQSTLWKGIADERERAPRDSSTTRFFAWV